MCACVCVPTHRGCDLYTLNYSVKNIIKVADLAWYRNKQGNTVGLALSLHKTYFANITSSLGILWHLMYTPNGTYIIYQRFHKANIYLRFSFIVEAVWIAVATSKSHWPGSIISSSNENFLLSSRKTLNK